MNHQQQATKRKSYGLVGQPLAAARKTLATATALLLILTALPQPTARASSPSASATLVCTPKSRIRGSHRFGESRIGHLPEINQDKHQGWGVCGRKIASDPLVYAYDGQGSVRLLTDENGAVTDMYTLDAFGNLTGSTGVTSNNFLYAGQQLDPDLGFYYLRARYASTTKGRFVSMDISEGLIFNPLSLRKYLYGEANPINNVDPSGLFASSLTETTTVTATRSQVAAALSEIAYASSNFLRFVRVAFLVGVTTYALLQQGDGVPSSSPTPGSASEPQPASQPEPSPQPPSTGTTTPYDSGNAVNLDTSTAEAFGMITSRLGGHPDLPGIIAAIGGRQMLCVIRRDLSF